MARQRKRPPIQIVLLPPVQQPGTEPANPEHVKAQERLNQLVGVLVEAALVRFKELSGDEERAEEV